MPYRTNPYSAVIGPCNVFFDAGCIGKDVSVRAEWFGTPFLIGAQIKTFFVRWGEVESTGLFATGQP
jgi:hypothetical protein